MSEQNRAQQASATVEKIITKQTARFETALAELGKLQAKGLAQASAYLESATRAAQEQVAFAEQLGGEWRKLVLAATRGAAEIFAPKA